MLGIGKNMVILLLSVTIISSAATFLTTQTLVEPSSPNDAAFLMGHMTLKVTDENGYVKDYRQTDNIITRSGWDTLVQTAFVGDYSFIPGVSSGSPTGSDRLNGVGGPFSHIGIGSDDGTIRPLNAFNDILGAELAGCTRSTLAIDSNGGSGGGIAQPLAVIEFTLFAGFDGSDPDCGFAISEAGVFNGTQADTGVTMFARNNFATVPALGAQDTLEIEWDFTFTGNLP